MASDAGSSSEEAPEGLHPVRKIFTDLAVPVLSHKEQRKQLKRKRKQGDVEPAENADEQDSAAKKQKQKHPERAKRSEYGIWVGNMNFSTTESKLRDWLAAGLLSHDGKITRVSMSRPIKPKEANGGHAHVDFDNETITNAAVKMSEGNLDGRRLLIKKNEDFGGRPNVTSSIKAVLAGKGSEKPAVDADGKETAAIAYQTSMSKTAKKIAEKQKNQPGPTLFIGNLSFETLDKDIRSMFEANQRASAKWAPKVKAGKTAKSGKKTAAEAVTSAAAKIEESSASSSEDDSASSESDDEKDSAAKDEARTAKDDGAGIRQIRMGTFEDTGKCKGWAFVDFLTPRQATVALLNPHNHRLNGRELKVEYAGLDAIRRGGNTLTPEMRKELDKANKGKKPFRRQDRKNNSNEKKSDRPIAPPTKILTLEELNAPAEKKHKPTREERQAMRAAKEAK